MASKRSRSAFESDNASRLVRYGTALPRRDAQTRDDGSFVPVWKQEVRDERGRKRLHGAFTGGFSAGYFNTVGSKEGWTPATFVSSRTSKKKEQQQQQQQRPEDFMDEEDLADVAAAQELQAAGDFSALGFTKSNNAGSGTLMDLFEPDAETGGVKLMRKMGWREGQGVGPKVRRKAKLYNEPGDADVDDAPMDDGEDHWFAPTDTGMVYIAPKHDRKGQGYVGEAKLGEDSAADKSDEEEQSSFSAFSAQKQSNVKPKKPSRTGFGVGVLNDDSDGEDPYEVGPRISYNKVIGGNKKKPKSSSQGLQPAPKVNPSVSATPVFLSKKGISAKTTSLQKCHDGKPPIEGSMLAEALEPLSLSVDLEIYPRPEVPEGWKSAKDPSAAKPDVSTYRTFAETAQASKLDAKSRGAMLGEAPLPGKSVFDFLSSEVRDRIAAASGKANLPVGRGEALPDTKGDTSQKSLSTVSSSDSIPDLDKSLAVAALGRGIGGWMPYSDDEPKRARYRAFLEFRAELTSTPPTRPPDMARESWRKELDEFRHAAEVFKPMTGLMASRFTTSSTAPNAVEEPTKDTSLLSTPASGASKKAEDPAEEAARMGMFGPLTRSSHRFFPSRLVCKRFNVKPPEHAGLDPDVAASASAGYGAAASSEAAKPPTAELVSKEAVELMMREASISVPARGDERGDARQDAGTSAGGATVPDEAAALHLKEAGDAVFNAIFENDSDDD